MVVFPHCKINIGLHVLARREDGFHDIETVFYPIGLSDILEVIPDPGSPGGSVTLDLTGITVDGNPSKNLVVKAYELLNQKFSMHAVKVHLHKMVPPGAGLGGGSADGAAMLTVLRDLFGLPLTNEELAPIARELGSDCPFFLTGRASIATGRGEILRDVGISLAGYMLYLFYPGAGISTGKAYLNIMPRIPPEPLEIQAARPVETWKDNLANVFEPYAFSERPVIRRIKEELYHNGAVYTSMTGSGSVVYGIFRNTPDLPEFLSAYLIWKEVLPGD